MTNELLRYLVSYLKENENDFLFASGQEGYGDTIDEEKLQICISAFFEELP